MEARINEYRIVVGIDGSKNATRALHWATDQARRSSGEVLAVHAIEQAIPLELAIQARNDLLSALHEQATKSLQRWALPLRNAEVPYREYIVDGAPPEVLLQIANDEDAALVVVGRQGLGTLPSLLLGSVSHRLIQQSVIPVVVIPPL